MTSKAPIAVVPPILPLKVTTPVPALIVKLLNPSTVEPNETLRFVLVIVVAATRVTAPPKLMSPDVAEIEPPRVLAPVTVIDPADMVTSDANVKDLNTAFKPEKLSVVFAKATTSPSDGQFGQLSVPPCRLIVPIPANWASVPGKLRVPAVTVRLTELAPIEFEIVKVPVPDFVMELDVFVRSVAHVTLRPLVSTLNA